MGGNLGGPHVTLFGSLATMLVLTTARRRGEDVGGGDFLRVGVIVTPLVLAGAALWLSFLAVP